MKLNIVQQNLGDYLTMYNRDRELFDLESWLCIHHPTILVEYRKFSDSYLIKENVKEQEWEDEE